MILHFNDYNVITIRDKYNNNITINHVLHYSNINLI